MAPDPAERLNVPAVEAVVVGRARLAGGAHSDASWSVRDLGGVLYRLDSMDGEDHSTVVDEAEVRRLIEQYGRRIVRWAGPLEPVDLGTDRDDLVLVDEVAWSWSLWQRPDGSMVLEVVCGSVGLYERSVVFDRPTLDALAVHGRRLVEVIAAEVRSVVT